MNNKNLKLKMQCVKLDVSLKELAHEMGISETQFNRKLNNRKTKNSFAAFTKCEKFYLSKRLNMNVNDIE